MYPVPNRTDPAGTWGLPVREEENETVSVRFEVLAIERVNRGRLVGLAVVEIEIAGINLKLVGIQIVQHSPHVLECNPPTFRHGRTGEWLPAVILPS